MNDPFIKNTWKKKNALWSSSWISSHIKKNGQLSSPFITIEQNQEKNYKILISYYKVSNAKSYNIYINDKLKKHTEDLSYLYEANKNGIYKIYVKAYGEGYEASEKSNIVFVSITDVGVFLIGNKKNILINMKKILIKQ